jgi:hypothetical protein
LPRCAWDDHGRLSLGAGRSASRARKPGQRGYGRVMAKDPEGPDGREDEYEHRTFVNLVSAAFLAFLALIALYALTSLDRQLKMERCLASGRRDCLLVEAPVERVREPVR